MINKKALYTTIVAGTALAVAAAIYLPRKSDSIDYNLLFTKKVSPIEFMQENNDGTFNIVIPDQNGKPQYISGHTNNVPIKAYPEIKEPVFVQIGSYREIRVPANLQVKAQGLESTLTNAVRCSCSEAQ